VIAELAKSYPLGAISNSMSSLPKHFLEESGLLKHFKVVVISGEIGYRKPHPEIFRQALLRLGVKPEQAVHIGNSLEEDIAGARNAGMRSVLITPRTIEEAVIAPDLSVPSLREVPWAVEVLSRTELHELVEMLGKRCILCNSDQICLYRTDEGEEDYALFCPGCRRESLRKLKIVPRKHGKYRAIYRRAWIEARKR
jgi:beta-phosphoglucomutase-like phosphatase (HAD superfamily)